MTTGNTAPNIKIDLYSDWIEILRGLLHAGGFKTNPKDTQFEVAVKYLNLKLREIAPQPRKVHKAKGFSCDAKYQKAIDEIERKAASGKSLVPHLSKFFLDLDYNDSLLNDWGLHHLHLSTKVGRAGFTERTGPLLFAHVLPDTFYMVAVLPHGSWTNRQLLEEMLKNWPHLLAPYELKGVVGLSQKFTEKEHAQLRKAHIQACVQLSDNKVYTSIGGGMASNGTNIRVVMAHDRWAYYFRDMEKAVKANFNTWQSSLPPDRKYANPPTFKLMLDDKNIPVVLEVGSKCIYKFN
ncbi:MAG: hypothetical protein PHV33_00270 [Elusimicrobiales bacterium]|nr:hypothetical protein [Elusimicrobiales bacterium]